ncbi:MAG TPA: RNA-guided endonuclease TnpB family protein [Chloroflexia bacterium]|nr:RNA-guided endonuclease TnpB family protein [Chloroflexia bacterium]
MPKLTRAITHIKLAAANDAKVGALDALATQYRTLCQQYVIAFCTDQAPDKFAAPRLPSGLSARWQRVAIQQAAGIAASWRSNRARAYAAYQEAVAEYASHPAEQLPLLPPGCTSRVRCSAGETDVTYPDGSTATYRTPLQWREPHVPELQQPVIQANTNVAKLEPSTDTSFDYWLRVSTLERGRPVWLPVKLAAYHRAALAGQAPNTSTTLTRQPDGWWLTLTIDEEVAPTAGAAAPVVGVDVGIVSFLTTSTGQQYGTFHGQLAARHKRDRARRRRKAKLRACLRKKGVTKLPSPQNKRLARHVRQSINRAVNAFYADHPGCQVAYEQLAVATMRFKARAMNAYLYAANLGHIPDQLEWGARKRGVRATGVKSAYSSQECSRCHYTERANRPTQQTFCCGVCGLELNADANAARNIAARLSDKELAGCGDRAAIKTLLLARHQAYLTGVSTPGCP